MSQGAFDRRARRRSRKGAGALPRARVLALAVAAWLIAGSFPALGAADVSSPALGEEPLARVYLPSQASVDPGVIRLGDFARVEAADPRLLRELEALEVGRAPLPGHTRSISVGTLRLRMRQARLPERAIEIAAESDSILVTTRYQVITKERLEAAIAQWYARNAPLPEGAKLILEVDIQDQWVPQGAVEIGIGLSQAKFGSVAVPLDIRIDGSPYRRVNASVKALVEQPVWVLARPVGRGETIGPADAVLSTRLFAQPVAGPSSFDRPLRATRALREGTPLTWDAVEPLPDVNKGDMVAIVAIRGGVYVQAPGEALADGRVGEALAVRNLVSGNIVYGLLSEDGTVLVQVP